MKRDALETLRAWKDGSLRKPLILRGARQIGKTWIVKELGKQFENFVAIDFEKEKSACNLFKENLVANELLLKIGIYTKNKIVPGKTLLFLDEIQACERAILALRYFYEEIPELHIIAAGSLLDFAIEKIGIPVGRVQFLYLYPLSFGEFLTACDRQDLRDYVKQQNIDETIHKLIMKELKIYLWLGGMPAVIDYWIQYRDIIGCQTLQDEILEAYKQDFSKYAKKKQIEHIDKVFQSIAVQLGNKFKYVHVDRDIKSTVLKEALSLLVKANVAHLCYHTSGQEQPLGASRNDNMFKAYFLDIGLAQRLLNLSLSDWFLEPLEIKTLGNMAEQFIAQELLAYASNRIKPQLYYWHREAKNSNAEIDFVTVKNNQIIPIEVKAGATGTLRSLSSFLSSHTKSPYGLKISAHHSFGKMDHVFHIPLYGLEAWLIGDK
ncbi:MAG: DUF4143 domain-containing protein [Pseudomonadota bacterium]|nr:DUF4143 domain-containing protein [Gammaproteobacteria bacterium]MBU1629317.1 DUF4143 domain-containing protein [Gammaproteobacteria bacterium]MBU1926505.1 DUF4143 domain-containing protein [Gammaproteobacteria bacterium]MBU2546686.1 DUF4143 domain-containing protein [Gammaproteobacteria bacterium]